MLLSLLRRYLILSSDVTFSNVFNSSYLLSATISLIDHYIKRHTMLLQSGKTVIANFLSDATETSSDDYHPTQGCRILEFEINNIPVPKGTNVNAEVELWDCSGDNKYVTSLCSQSYSL